MFEDQNLSLNGTVPVAMATAQERATFLKKTYLHVAGAFAAFVGVEALLFASGIATSIMGFLTGGWAMIILMFGFMFAAGAVEKWALNATDKKTQYLALGAYVILEAVIFIPLIMYALMVGGSTAISDILIPGVIITTALFAGLVLTVLITGKDFSFLKAFVGIGFFIAIGVAVIGMIAGFNLGSWFSIAMIVLMAAAILYQTSQIMHVYHEEQYVAASVSVFASFMTLLFYVIRLISARE